MREGSARRDTRYRGWGAVRKAPGNLGRHVGSRRRVKYEEINAKISASACSRGYDGAGPSEDVGAVVDRWATAFNSNDVDALVNLYAPDAILVGTAGLTLNRGNEAQCAPITPAWQKAGTKS